jgi:shikimate dehydrogenase
MKKNYAVIGDPIDHSKSPVLHQAGFVELEIDASFTAVAVRPENLETFMRTDFVGYSGLAVTLPHKETIGHYLDGVSAVAQQIGAVNTVYREADRILGTNTDCVGALRALETEVSDLRDQSVLVLGAGGASRALVFALLKGGARVMIYNRTIEKAEKIVHDFGGTVCPDLEALRGEHFDIICNTTSVGLKKWESPLPADFFVPDQVVFDMVYDPLETRFLSEANAAGARTITGDKMLVYQALEQFRIWHHRDLAPEVMEAAFFII